MYFQINNEEKTISSWKRKKNKKQKKIVYIRTLIPLKRNYLIIEVGEKDVITWGKN